MSNPQIVTKIPCVVTIHSRNHWNQLVEQVESEWLVNKAYYDRECQFHPLLGLELSPTNYPVDVKLYYDPEDGDEYVHAEIVQATKYTTEEFADKIRNNPHIPTGPDYHIARAKSALRNLELASRPLIHGTTNTEDLRISAGHAMHYTGEALEHIIRALELMRG